MSEERIISKVQKILERAAHPNTPEHERETCIAMADRMMLEHAIDEAMLDLTLNKNERRTPEKRVFNVYDPHAWYGAKMRTIVEAVAKANRVRAAIAYDGEVTLVGFRDDIDWVEMLQMHIFRDFVAKIDPRWETSKTFDENVRSLKEAGKKWAEIWSMGYRALGEMPCGIPPKDGSYMIRAYRRQCKRDGVEPNVRTQRHDVYKLSFAEGFTDRLVARLRDQVEAAKETTAKTTGAELALRDVSQQVDEAFFELFPHLRPKTHEEMEAIRKQWREEAEAEAEKRANRLASMTSKQRAKFLEQEERARRREQARYNAWFRKNSYVPETDGERAGARAANSVDITRKGTVENMSRGELR